MIMKSHLKIFYILLFSAVWGNSVAADVKCVQEQLAQTAFDPGPVDGAWGRKTKAALDSALQQIGQHSELGRADTDEACTILSTLSEDDRNLLRYRVYDVVIDAKELAKLSSKPAFD